MTKVVKHLTNAGGDDREGHRAEAQPGTDIRAGQRDHQDVHHGGGLARDSGPEGHKNIPY